MRPSAPPTRRRGADPKAPALRVMQLSAASPKRPKTRPHTQAQAQAQAHPPPPVLAAVESARGHAGQDAAAAQPHAPDDVLLAGALHKRGAFFRAWLPRHVELSRAALRVFRRDPRGAGDAERDARRLLKDELRRVDAVRAEPADGLRGRPFAFALVVRKRPRRFLHGHSDPQRKESNLDTSAASAPAAAADTGRVLVLYFQASREAERARWLKALQRWIDGFDPLGTQLPPSPSGSSALVSVGSSASGRVLLQFVLAHQTSHRSAFRKFQHREDDEISLLPSPADQRLANIIERELPVLTSLIRELDACEEEGELVYILDQVLGEVQEAFLSPPGSRRSSPAPATVRGVRTLVAAAGEAKLDSCPQCWTDAVRVAYAAIMRALHVATKAADSLGALPVAATSLEPPRRPCDSDSEAENTDAFHDTYKLGRQLGAGGFSVVHVAADRATRKQVAVKCIAKRGLGIAALRAMQHEISILSTLDHPNIVPLLRVFDEPDYCYIVTPLCTGGELFDALVKRKSYTEADARLVLQKLADAVAYLHARGIVHRDLKPENILLKSSAPGAEMMIADFGLARDLSTVEGSRRRLTACGTPGYVAPEVVKGEPYGAEVDCWSLGVILFILLCGYPPFGGANHAVVLDKVASGAYEFESPYWDNVSAGAKDLVRKLLTVDRTKRMRAEDVAKHSWMRADENVESADEGERKGAALEGDQQQSDLMPALSQMRAHNHTILNGSPRFRLSDLDEAEADNGVDNDADERALLERELMGLGLGGRNSLDGNSDEED